ncbi:MAG: hypothetical protein M1839_001879 [Geoglossum umbratile]|nr:MAG: hypothetical protein M1839_001879 [Geoglossum umbratile]
MDISQAYAIVIGGSFFLILLINSLPLIARLVRYLSPLISKHLIYRYILHRHWLLGPWSRAGVLVQLIYIAGNIFCFSFWVSTISQASLRAGTLSIINLIPLFAGPHLSALADLLGVTLSTFRQIHRSVGVMAVLLAVFHVLVAVALRPSFALHLPQNLFAVIGVSSLCCVLLLSLPLFRRPAYELFLRTHHALAALSAYAIWRHLPSDKLFPRCYLYISAGLFLFMCTVQGGIIIYQNGFFRYSCARAHITHEYGAVRLRIQCQKPLDVKAGQYINLWIPSVSFWSFMQSHPFVVISWAEKPQDHLDLFIEPRRGLTRELLSHAMNRHATNHLVLFSGPHGKSVPVDDCENILMVASGFGIAAQLPYLKQLIHGYNAHEVRARRIHLVWQVRDIDVTIAAQPLLNGALKEDTLDDGWILAISIYCESSDIRNKSFGKRANVYPGKAPVRDILQAEVAGEHIEKKLVDNIDWDTKALVEEGKLESGRLTRRDGRLLVIVSGTEDIRDELRSVVRDHLRDEVSFFELDYQPS